MWAPKTSKRSGPNEENHDARSTLSSSPLVGGAGNPSSSSSCAAPAGVPRPACARVLHFILFVGIYRDSNGLADVCSIQSGTTYPKLQWQARAAFKASLTYTGIDPNNPYSNLAPSPIVEHVAGTRILSGTVL